jgi:hypothetical protein
MNKPTLQLFALTMMLLLSASVAKADQYGDFTYSTDGTNVTIIGYTGSGGVVSIPDKIYDQPVTIIGADLFHWSDHNLLTSIIIPDSVTYIGKSAFYYCTSLTNVTFGTNVSYIGENSFYLCTSLTSVTIPNSVTTIWHYAFGQCASLTSVTIPNNVTSLGGGGVFSHCTSLTNVIIGSGITSIPQDTFRWCSNLTSIIIPTNVTSIGDTAFDSCPSLTGIYFRGSAPSIGSDIFNGDTSATVFHLLETVGWPTVPDLWADRPTALWNLAPPMGISTYSGQPVVFFPTATGTNYVLEMTTNLNSGNWVAVTNGIPFSGVQIPNAPGTAFFRLH